MKIELHILQSFPPSNLNRDDTGMPKDCEFGGYRRARISSQCIKRSIRRDPAFSQTLDQEIAVRTRKSRDHLVALLSDKHPEEERVIAASGFIEAIGLKKDAAGIKIGEKGRTDILIYAGKREYNAIANNIEKAWPNIESKIPPALKANQKLAALTEDERPEKEKKEEIKIAHESLEKAMKPVRKGLQPVVNDFIKVHKGRASTVDIALFGRMLAQEPQLNLDAACQVAHALSTHRISMEFDYFTAVDDLQEPHEETGAGMIGSQGFNSACYYRYALIDFPKLVENLSGDTDLAAKGVKAFLLASVAAIPTGKANSTAPQTPPGFVLAVIRERGVPWSLVNGFEIPVRPENGGGLLGSSVKQLVRHWESLKKGYGADGISPFSFLLDDVCEPAVLGSLEKTRVDSISMLAENVSATLLAKTRAV